MDTIFHGLTTFLLVISVVLTVATAFTGDFQLVGLALSTVSLSHGLAPKPL